MNKEERKTVIFLILSIPYSFLIIIFSILTISVWLISKKSFKDTFPLKLLFTALDYLEDKGLI